MATAHVTGPGVQEMKILAVKIREAPPELRRNLRRQFREAGKPIVRDVQRSILSMPAEHYPGRGLREEVAATVYASVSMTKTQVQLTIVSSGRRMPPGKRSLPFHLDAAEGWAHPVFARGGRFRLGPSHARKYQFLPESFRPLVNVGRWTWTRQMGKPGWFENPVIADAPEARRACQAAIEETLRRLA